VKNIPAVGAVVEGVLEGLAKGFEEVAEDKIFTGAQVAEMLRMSAEKAPDRLREELKQL
jgi:hypothetical protein